MLSAGALQTRKPLCDGCELWQVHGRDWKRLQEAIPTKTMTQIKNRYQNYKVKVRQLSVSGVGAGAGVIRHGQDLHLAA